jgi:hypothetical protein
LAAPYTGVRDPELLGVREPVPLGVLAPPLAPALGCLYRKSAESEPDES